MTLLETLCQTRDEEKARLDALYEENLRRELGEAEARFKEALEQVHPVYKDHFSPQLRYIAKNKESYKGGDTLHSVTWTLLLPDLPEGAKDICLICTNDLEAGITNVNSPSFDGTRRENLIPLTQDSRLRLAELLLPVVERAVEAHKKEQEGKERQLTWKREAQEQRQREERLATITARNHTLATEEAERQLEEKKRLALAQLEKERVPFVWPRPIEVYELTWAMGKTFITCSATDELGWFEEITPEGLQGIRVEGPYALRQVFWNSFDDVPFQFYHNQSFYKVVEVRVDYQTGGGKTHEVTLRDEVELDSLPYAIGGLKELLRA